MYLFKNYISDITVEDKDTKEDYLSLSNILVDYCKTYTDSK